MAENPLESKMDGYLAELRQVEATVNSQLEVLSTTVDQTFGQISEMVGALTALAVDSTEGYVSNETRAKIGLVGAGVAVVTNMVGNYRKAKQRNAELDRLLKTKQEMAQTRADVLKKIEPVQKRVLENLEKGLAHEAKRVYSVAEVETPERWKLILDRMDKYLDMYRTAVYLSMVVDYLEAEYAAWLSGRQSSKVPRPDYYAANKYLISILEKSSGENATSTFVNVFAQKPETISGSTIYYLMDSQLASTLLIARDSCEMLPQPHDNSIRFLCQGNAGVEHFMNNSQKLQERIETGPERCYYSYVYTSIIGVIIIALLWICDKSFWWILLTIAAAAGIGYLGQKQNEYLEEKYQEEIETLTQNLGTAIWEDAGKVNFPEVNLEKRSPFLAAFFGA